MKEALYSKRVKDKIQCVLCPHFCVIANGKRGKCGVRKVEGNKLYALSYGLPCSTAIDPIEKKPLHHFLPSSTVYSISTPGCNLSCKYCQNWEISQALPETFSSRFVPPTEVVTEALSSNCASIAYTYTEPTIFFEYALDIAKLAHKKKLKNVTVTNGFINPEPAEELYRHIDATNIDLKGMSDTFYKSVCGARLAPVLDSIVQIHEMGVWVELTNLIIPTKNDSPKMIKKMCEWIVENVGDEVPLHFSRFFPRYKFNTLPVTPIETLTMAQKIAFEAGIKYVYTGNVATSANTICPNCGTELVWRQKYDVKVKNLKHGKCTNCGEKIAGVWD